MDAMQDSPTTLSSKPLFSNQYMFSITFKTPDNLLCYAVTVEVFSFHCRLHHLLHLYGHQQQPVSSLLWLNKDRTLETLQHLHFLTPQIQPVFLNQHSLF